MDPEIKGSPPGLSFLMPGQGPDGLLLSRGGGGFIHTGRGFIHTGAFKLLSNRLFTSLLLKTLWNTWIVLKTAKWASEGPCVA